MRGSPLTRFKIILISLFAGAVMLVGICWQLSDNWKKRTHGRNWPTVSAVIDIVSVAFVEDDIPSIKAYPDTSYYQATLTYTYHNPERKWATIARGSVAKKKRKAGPIPTRGVPSWSTWTRAIPGVPCCEKKTFRWL
jgi:hypothetical protein